MPGRAGHDERREGSQEALKQLGEPYIRSIKVRMVRQKPVRLKWLWMPSQTKRR